ncbi:hypothetical protein HYU07_07695 [Candidatus Woesearchaeota archaeon]|nr:hypothetical protein [Candidatus Woesearchaeota archaeon]
MNGQIMKTIKGTMRECNGDYWTPIGLNMFGGYLVSDLAALVPASYGHDGIAKGVILGGMLITTLNFVSEGIRTGYQIYKRKETEKNSEKKASGLSEIVQNCPVKKNNDDEK